MNMSLEIGDLLVVTTATRGAYKPTPGMADNITHYQKPHHQGELGVVSKIWYRGGLNRGLIESVDVLLPGENGPIKIELDSDTYEVIGTDPQKIADVYRTLLEMDEKERPESLRSDEEITEAYADAMVSYESLLDVDLDADYRSPIYLGEDADFALTMGKLNAESRERFRAAQEPDPYRHKRIRAGVG